MSDLRIVALNLHAGAGDDGRRKANDAVNLMDDNDAAVGVFTEAKTVVRPLERMGVDLVGEHPESRAQAVLPEEGDTIVVVDHAKVRRSRIVVQKLRFLVRSKNRWHDPRRDPVVMLRGRVRGVWAMHGPPGGPGSINGKAWCAQMDAALNWVSGYGCRVIVGDINANAATVAKYAADRGYDVQVAGRGVDLVIVSGGSVRHRNLGDQGPGYDHKAGLYDVTAGPGLIARLLKRQG